MLDTTACGTALCTNFQPPIDAHVLVAKSKALTWLPRREISSFLDYWSSLLSFCNFSKSSLIRLIRYLKSAFVPQTDGIPTWFLKVSFE